MKLDLPEGFSKTYKKNEVIFAENSSGNEMYVISSGEVRISSERSGDELELAILKEGDFFGEMALVDSEPRVAKATAVADGTCLIVLDHDKFLHLVTYKPDFALSIIQTQCHRIREIYKLYSKENPKRASYDYQKLISIFAGHRL